MPDARDLALAPRRRHSIRWHLSLLLAAAIVPVVIALALVMLNLHFAQVSEQEAELRNTTRRLADLVEREMDGYVSSLLRRRKRLSGKTGRRLTGKRVSWLSDGEQQLRCVAPTGSNLLIHTPHRGQPSPFPQTPFCVKQMVGLWPRIHRSFRTST
jgi:hypothetical protein